MATAAKKVAKLGLGATIDKMAELRDKKHSLEEAIKLIDGEYQTLESALMEQMAEQGLDKMSGTTATVSISSTVVANVEDWDALLAYIYRNKLGHLLQRRVSDPAYRELLEHGKKVPGASPFTKLRLNLRTR